MTEDRGKLYNQAIGDKQLNSSSTSFSLETHHSILAPVCQAVVHRDLLPLRDVSDCYDNQPHLGAAVDFSNTTVWRRMEEHRSPNTACSLLTQLWHTEKQI